MINIAAIQLNTGIDRAKNLARLTALIDRAVNNGAQLIVTPEMTNVLDRRARRLFENLPIGEDLAEIHAYAALAKKHQIYLVIGSLAIVLDDDFANRKAANRQMIFAPNGDIIGRYDKAHMFDVDLPNGESWKESNVYAAGDEMIMTDVHIGDEQIRLGSSICYDVRFPYMYRKMAQQGAHIMMIPAAFTKPTGEAHWEILLRARAIETGSYVIAPAQSGTHEDGRETWGQSMIIAPWGEILTQSSKNGEDCISAKIDISDVAKSRQAIPNLTKTVFEKEM